MSLRRFAVSLAAATACCFVVAGAGPAGAAITTLSGPERIKVDSPRDPRGLTLKSGVVIDAANGDVLWSRQRDDVRAIASTTKIMTALVALQRSKPSDVLTATRYPAQAGESLLGLKAGERMRADDLITALLLTSANDAADTLAVNLASSKSAFVAAMNRRARELGLRNTQFGNPVGLDRPRTVSTASELALLARAAMRNPEFARIVGRSRARLRSGSRARTVYNRNELVGSHDFVTGVKTGHTMKAGYVLVGAAERLDADVISVALGEPSIPARNRDTLKLLRHGRAHFTVVPALARGRTAITLQTTPGDNPVPLVSPKGLRIAARNGDVVKVVAATRDDVRGPLERGTRLGTAWVERNGKRVANTPLVTTAAVAEPTSAEWMGYVLDRTLPVIVVLAILFMMAFGLMWRRSKSGAATARREGRDARTASP